MHEVDAHGMRHYSYWLVIYFIVAAIGVGGHSQLHADELIQQGAKLTLEQCIDIALKSHPQIIAAMNTINVNINRVGQSRSGYYPQIGLSAGVSRNASSLRADQYNQYSNNLSVNQNVYDFNKVGTKVDIQSLNLDSARADSKNTSLIIILGVKQAYYEVLRAKHAKDISTDTVKQFEQHLETAKGLYEAGSKPIIDVTKAEVDLSNARVNLLRAENALILAVVTLNNAIGMPAAPPFDLEDDVAHQLITMNLDDALKTAYDKRPDLQSSILQKYAIQKSIELAKKDYLPTLSGNANYGWSGQEYPLDRGWNIGATLNFNIFSGYLTKNQVGEAVASLEVSKAGEDGLRQTIRLEVEQSYANLQSAEKGIAAAETALRYADENLGLAQGRYAAGVGSPLEVTDALVAQGNARLALSGSLYDYKIAEAGLQKAMGEK